MATVFVPAQMRDVCQGQIQLPVDPGTLRQVLAELGRRHPGFTERVLDKKGVLLPYLSVLIDGDEADLRGGMLAPVGESSEVHIILAMAGGTGWNKGQGKGGRAWGDWG